MPRHEFSLIRSQIQGRPRHVILLAHGPPQLPQPIDHPHYLLPARPRRDPPELLHHHRRRDRGRRDAVDPNPVGAQLARHRPHHPGHRELGHRVGVGPQPPQDPAYARGAQDGSRPGRDHDAGRVLDPGHRAPHVDGHHGVELTEVEVRDAGREGGPRDPGHVAEDVEPGVAGEGEVDGVGDLGLGRHVARYEVGRGAQFGAGKWAQVGVDVGDYDMGSLLDEGTCRGLPQPAGAAGYKGYFAF